MTNGKCFAKRTTPIEPWEGAAKFPVHPRSASLLPSLFPLENSLFAPAGKFLAEMTDFPACFGHQKSGRCGAFFGFSLYFSLFAGNAVSGQSAVQQGTKFGLHLIRVDDQTTEELVRD